MAIRRLIPVSAGLALLLVAGLPTIVMAQADPSTATPAESGIRAYRIAPGTLPDVLNRLVLDAGQVLSYDGRLTEGLYSDGLEGRYTFAAALDRLLAPHALGWRYLRPGVVTVQPRATADGDGAVVLSPVRIEGGPQLPRDGRFDGAGSVEVITDAQLQKVPVTSARDIFAGSPGVWVMDGRQNPGLNINIRGIQGPGRNNVMIDGARQNFARYGGYNGVSSQVYVDPDLIANVTVEKGPVSGAHGAGAVGGVVALRTLEADDLIDEAGRFGARLRGSSGSDAFHGSGSLAGGWRVNDWIDMAVGVAARHTGDYASGERDPEGRVMEPTSLVPNPPVPGEGVPHTQQKSRSALLKLAMDLPHAQTLKLGGTLHENEYSYDRLGFSTIYGSPTEGRAHTLTSKYAWAPKGRDLFDLRANVWLARSRDADLDQDSVVMTIREIRTTGFELFNTSRWSPSWGDVHLTYGGELFEDDASQTQGLDVGGKRRISGGFVQARWFPLNWLEAGAGLRYDTYTLRGAGEALAPLPGQNPLSFWVDRGDDALSPSLSLLVMPIRGIQLYVRNAEGFRPPVLSEAMMSGQAFITPIVPNFALTAETSENREVGINLQRNGLWRRYDRLRFKAAYFDNRYQDYIRRDYTTFGAISALSFENLDRALFAGWELQGGYDIGWLYAEASYTHFVRMRFCDDGSCEGQVGSLGDWGSPNIPPTRKVTADTGVRLWGRRITLGARMRHDSDVVDVTTQEDYSWRWKGYRLYDVYGHYDVHPALRLAFSVENLRDNYYVDALSGGRLPGPGRNARFSFTYTFR